MAENKNMPYNFKILNDETPFGIAEAYNLARTNIMYLKSDLKCPVYGITSPMPHDGKSLTTTNIAISFAKLGKKVLIIDCDMRNPTQAVMLNAKVRAGLSEYLSGIKSEPAMQKTGIDGLTLIAAGKVPPNPAELLNSEKMKALIDMAKEQYDIVFLDFPPVNIVSDATVMAPMVDGYIFIVMSGTSNSKLIRVAKQRIAAVSGRLVGFVLNAVKPKHGLKYGKKYGYGNYSYGYSYGETPKPKKTKKQD